MSRLLGVLGLCLALLSGCGFGGGGREARDGTCGVPGLVAEARPEVVGPGACGIAEPVAVTRVAGVDLSRPALMTCETARALDSWVRDGAIPAVGNRGGGIKELTVAAHYVCKTRNSRPGARLSEHAKGKAIDISAVVLRDGNRITVLEGWRQPSNSRILRRMHAAACGPFGTVLGPESDRFHQGHFHLDTARYRSGPYCR